MESTLCFRYGTPPSLSLPTRAPNARHSTYVGNNLHYGHRPSSISLACASKSRQAFISRNFTFETSSMNGCNFLSQKIVALPNSASRMNSRDAVAFPKVFCSSTHYTPPSGKDELRTLFYIWLKSSTKPIVQPTERRDPDTADIAALKMNILEGWSLLSQTYNKRRPIEGQSKPLGAIEMDLFMALVEVFICLGKFKEAKLVLGNLEKHMQQGKSEVDSGIKFGYEITERKKINLYKAVIYAALDNKKEAKEFLEQFVENVTNMSSEPFNIPISKLPPSDTKTEGSKISEAEAKAEAEAEAKAEAEAEAISSLVRAIVHTIYKENEADQYWKDKDLSHLFKSS